MKKKTYIKYEIACIISIFMLTLSGCASTDELAQIKTSISALYNDFNQFKNETNTKLFSIAKENQNLSKQMLNVSASMDSREDKTKTILGKIDELEHQLQTYWNETKNEINALKKPGSKTPFAQPAQPVEKTPAKIDNVKYEATYKEAFDSFLKGSYEESIRRFTDFAATYPDTPLVSNAYYWIGESYMNLKNYDKAILSFQEVIDKYPKSDKTARALLSQAEAFNNLKDGKSSTTILKKVVELYPKTEEAAVAERKLKSLGVR